MSNGVILAGLPATGKTSYLALLYHAIVVERADGLSLGRYDDDRAYVTEISDALLASRVAGRTGVDDERDVTLSLTYDGEDFVLEIPDLSGETWEHALVERRWSQELHDDIADAAGFMVFVHCGAIDNGLTIVDVDQATAALVGDDDAPNGAGQDQVKVEQRESPGAATRAVSGNDREQVADADEGDEETHCTQLTQVSLVELIQFFAATSPRPIRVSLVISAWDLEPRHLTPQEWLSKTLPMLAQFLEVNTDEVDAMAWGVSAQGADLGDEQVREKYKDKDPIDRAQIRDAEGSEAGVAAPLLWVLRRDQ